MSLDNQNDVILSDEDLLRVTTDLDDYAPGSTAIVTAEGVDVGGSVTFEVEHVSDAGEDGVYGTADDTVVDLGGDGHDSWTVVDGGEGDLDGEANGVIVTSWYVNPDDSLDETFLLSADDGSDLAFWSFTDSLPPAGVYVEPSSDAGDGSTPYDLTALDSPTFVGPSGAIWTNDIFGAGTGVIDPFLRIQGNGSTGTEDGVNTSGDLNNDEKAQANGYTRDLLLSEVGQFTSAFLDPTNGISVLDDFAGQSDGMGGTYDSVFFEFRLDINENSNSNGDQYLSLDELMIFISTEDNLTIDATDVYGQTAISILDYFYDSDTGAAPTTLSLLYDLDATGEENWIALNYDLQAGSGVGDIATYIPLSAIQAAIADLMAQDASYDGTLDTTYVYLVSAFGNQGSGDAPKLTADDEYDQAGGTRPKGAEWGSSDGFEEWSVIKNFSAPGAIEGYKIHDLDADGVNDPEDTGIGDWKIYLYIDDGDGVFDAGDVSAGGAGETVQYENADRMTQTVNSGDMVGYYNFANLQTGLTYWIVEANDKIDETGWLNSQDTTVTIDGFDYVVLGPVTLLTGQTYGDDAGEATDFLNYKLGSISGTKYLDENGDGTRQDTETTGVAGITIELLQGGEVVGSTVTDADGNWAFNDLEPGTYSVREVLTDSGYVTKAVTIHENIVVTSDDHETGYEFLNYQLGEISGRKYVDQDGDGAGGTDTNKTGWTIYLYRDNGDGVFTEADGDAIATDVTDAGGYSFTGLEMGTYFVVEADRNGWVATSPVMVEVDGTSSGFDAQNVDFYNFKLFSISGTKYHDRNADGVIDADDDTWGDDANEGTVTVYVELDGLDGLTAGDKSAVVQSDGTWEITGLDWTADGANVYEILPDGTYQSLGPVEGVDTVDATSGNDQTGFDFANYLPGKIEGTKYYDGLNADDTPLAGWKVELYASDGAGNATGPVLATDFTNGSGNYEFGDLTPGTYVVVESLPDGWSATGGVTTHEVTVGSGETVEVNTDDDPTDFYNRSSVIIGGEKREDDDGDGDFGDADDGLENWTINIWYDADDNGFQGAASDDVLITATTDASGAWTATLYDIGDYYVEEVDQLGWTQSSTPETYLVTVTYDADTGNDPDVGFDPGLEVTVSDRTATTLDFLNYQSGGITGEKYYGGTGYALVGWEVTLYESDPEAADGLGAEVGSTLTGAGGIYSFANLDPGDYVVVESVPDGWEAYDGGPTQHLVTVTSGETTGIDSDATDFRNVSEIGISGTKYEDANADGSIAGDSALTDVSFNIQIWKDGQAEGEDGHGEVGLGDTLIDTVSTDGSGNWSYTLDALGSYIVRELVPDGWTQSYPAGDTYSFDVVYDNDLDGDAGTFDPGLVIEGVSDKDDLDFANWAPGKIEGYKWEDLDGSNDTTDDRLAIQGWKITLIGDVDGDGDEDEVVAYTDFTGRYVFDGLAPGDYTVVEETRDGVWFNVTPISIDVNGLTSREIDSGNDFVNTQYGKISGHKWEDADGTLGGERSAKSGWTIYLLDAGGEPVLDGDDQPITATTDENGYYEFTMLRPGTYIVAEETRDGWIAIDEVEVTLDGLQSGFDIQDVDFTNFEKFSVTGTKYEDKTGDGLTDDDTPWGAGVRIYIEDNGIEGYQEGEDRATLTDADGNYRFDGLTLADVGKEIYEDPNSIPGTTQTGILVQTIENPGSGGTDEDNDFTNFINFDLTGRKFIDLDGDGQQDPETPGENAPPVDSDGNVVIVRIGLYIDDGNPDTALQFVEYTNTNASGFFSFGDLGPLPEGSTYVVREIGEYIDPVVDGDGNMISNSGFIENSAGGSRWVVTTEDAPVTPESGGGEAAGGVVGDILIGNYQDFSLTGTKYEDYYGDGSDLRTWLPEYGEVVIYIEDNGVDGYQEGEDRATTVGDDGTYSFTGLTLTDVGKAIYEIIPDGTVQTDSLGTFVQYIDDTPSGGVDEDNDFTNYRKGSIEGYKFWDDDRDGTWDEDEVGLYGWTIELYRDNGDGVLTDADGGPVQTTVSADGENVGYWSFDGLEFGTYFVKEQLMAGYVQTTPDLLGDGYFKVVVDESGEVVFEAADDSPTYDYVDDTGAPALPNDGKLWIGNDKIDGPGVRTPGFWQSDLGQTFWDGDPTNDGVLQEGQAEKTGDEFADDDVIYMNYEDNGYTGTDDGSYPYGSDGLPKLLVGDWNTNLLEDDGVPILAYTHEDALKALEGGQSTTDTTGKKGKNTDYAGVDKIERDLVAAWLNYLAGNATGTEIADEDVQEWINDAILYVDAYKTGSGLSRKDLKTAWNTGLEDLDGDGDLEVGSEIHNALDGWNNWGLLAGSYVSFDGDAADTAVFASYVESHESVA